MLYSLGDKFVVQGVLCEVRFISHKKALVCPAEDGYDREGRRVLMGLVMNVLDERGKDLQKNKAFSVTNKECQAV